MELKDRNVVITGGASGIGYAMAERFGREGARLVLADVEEKALDEAVARLKAGGVEAIGVVADVSRYADVEALAARATSAFGNVHILCNNAGVSITGPSWELTTDDWYWVWDVNVGGVIHGVKAFLPAMMAHGEPAHVINTGSISSFFGIGTHGPYCASKAAVLGFSQALNAEMRAGMTNVTVSILCPGMVATKINQSWRNRPSGHKPWSEREFKDTEFMARSDAFQGAGIPVEIVADRVREALDDGRFYIFTEDGAGHYIAGTTGQAAQGIDPYVITWGEDLRPERERGTPPWGSAVATP